ncbi:hypothetical protein [Chryseotalea sanaruensis]|nr:hypothetical protein [Chryseotalea sanaruensis]
MRFFHFKIGSIHLLTIGMMVFPAALFAQNYPSGPTSLSPAVQPVYKVDKRTREVKRVQPKVKRSAEYAFYDRVQKAAKMKKRTLRKLAKPQYTNPLYFGHKNPPKKREPHKMRYCQECGIRH